MWLTDMQFSARLARFLAAACAALSLGALAQTTIPSGGEARQRIIEAAK